MIIIELPNGTKVHADGVDIAPDGHIYAYDQTEDPEDEDLKWSELEPDLQQAILNRLAPMFQDKVEHATPQEIALASDKLHGTWRETTLAGKINELSQRHLDVYNWFAQEGPISVKNLEDITGLTKSTIHSRMIPLRQKGLLVRDTAIAGRWKAVV